ncbi:MAG TPA: DUF6434 domain-containing protein [Aeromicrobium sp.]|nr:DUF6434 domain-containing protein [Aeromicrobium sp.]
MPAAHGSRPPLDSGISAAEFQRWYWLKEELANFARSLGIRSTGGKELLAARIAARLDGREFSEPAVSKRTGGPQLSGPLSPDTVVPANQRCSQIVRAWMSEQVGDGFHFDAEMRAFFAESDGTLTMQDALDRWRATRGQGQRGIDPQFEYNRFTRAWHESHPDGNRDELMAAWQAYRASPLDERGRA